MSGDCDKIPCPTCESGTTIPATGWACRYSDLTACGKHGNLCARCIEDRADARALVSAIYAVGNTEFMQYPDESVEQARTRILNERIEVAIMTLRLARKAGRKP